MAYDVTSIPELDRQGLRKFGITTGSIFGVLFGVLLPWLFDYGFPWWPWVVLAILVGWSIVAPDSLRPVYWGWMRLGLLISRVTTPIVMGAAFYLVVTPVGLVRRLLGKDSLDRVFDSSASTYRKKREERSGGNLENPY